MSRRVKRREPFTMTPVALTFDRRLSMGARVLWSALDHLAYAQRGDNEDGPVALPPLVDVAALIGASDSATRGYLAELKASGYVETLRNGAGNATVYAIRSTPATGLLGLDRPPKSGGSLRRIPAEDHGSPHETRARDQASKTTKTERADALSTRRRDPVWDAIVEETGSDARLEAGRIAAAKKLIVAAVLADLERSAAEEAALNATTPVDPTSEEVAAITAGEVRRRAAMYRDRWPSAELTPTALARNWSRVAQPRPGVAAGGERSDALDRAVAMIDSGGRLA